MDRDRQIELMKSAEERVSGYVRSWIQKDSRYAEVSRRPNPHKPSEQHGQTVVRKRACA